MIKKSCAIITALGMLVALAAAPGAAEELKLSTQENTSFALSVDPTKSGASYSLGMPVLYTFGPQAAGSTMETGGMQAYISLCPRLLRVDGTTSDAYKITRITVRVVKGPVTAHVELNDGTTRGGKTAPVLSLQAAAGADVCDPQDYAVAVDMTVGDFTGFAVSNKRTITVTLSGTGAAAYSRVRDMTSGGVYDVDEAQGSVFRIGRTLSAPVRVTCPGVALTLEGRYDAATVNLRTATDAIEDLTRGFSSSEVQVYDFVGAPQFSADVQVAVSAPEDARIYAYHAQDGGYTPIVTRYEKSAHVFLTQQLGCYFTVS